jgi:predicted O-methyltransferase YrrM
MNEYQFTKDWFHWAPEVWTQLIPMLPERKAFLEIGSFEGRSTVWIVENMMNPGDWIDCVDTWEGGEEHGEEDMAAVEARFHHNVDIVLGGGTSSERASYDTGDHFTRFASDGPDAENNRIYKYKSTSAEFLGRKLASNLAYLKPDYVPMYDFIYIDGSHIAKDVLTDACMAWPLLKPKGLMVFDDYMWGNPRDILHRPKPAIDAFTNIFAEEVDIVHVGYQLVVRKKGE